MRELDIYATGCAAPVWLVPLISQVNVRYDHAMAQKHLPPFAAAWMQQWKAAGPALQRVRDEELRALDGSRALEAASFFDRARTTNNYSGLIEQQAWFMRKRVLDAMREVPPR